MLHFILFFWRTFLKITFSDGSLFLKDTFYIIIIIIIIIIIVNIIIIFIIVKS